MAALIGGILYSRVVLAPGKTAPEGDLSEADRAAVRFRPIVVAAISGLIVSGVYNILSVPGHSLRYHVLLGIKLLLAGHVFASALLITRPHNPRRTRMLTGALISGLVIIAISVYLRRTF